MHLLASLLAKAIHTADLLRQLPSMGFAALVVLPTLGRRGRKG